MSAEGAVPDASAMLLNADEFTRRLLVWDGDANAACARDAKRVITISA